MHMGIEAPSREVLKQRYEERLPLYEEILNALVRRVEEELKTLSIKASSKHRVKSFDSYFRKILARLREKERTGREEPITDILGIRIVCPFLENIQEVENLVRRLFLVVEVDKKGNGHSVKEFGYESTHLLIGIPPDLRPPEPVEEELFCEIQIRTILQDAWAEVEHELVYKAEFTPFDKPLKRKLAALNANLTLSDIIFQEIREYQRQLQRELKRRRNAFFTTVSERNAAFIPTPPETRESAKQEGEEEDEGLVAGAGNSIDEFLLRGLLAHNAGNYGKAIEIYTKLVKLEVQEMKGLVYVHRGMAYFAESRYEEALSDFSKSIELEPGNPRPYYLRGITYRMTQEYSEALKDFNTAISLDPFQFDFLYARAQVYFHMGDYPESLADCERAGNIDPSVKEVEELKRIIRKKLRM